MDLMTTVSLLMRLCQLQIEYARCSFVWAVLERLVRTNIVMPTGRKYDSEGNVMSWWHPEAEEVFARKKQCFVDQYGSMKAEAEGFSYQVKMKCVHCAKLLINEAL